MPAGGISDTTPVLEGGTDGTPIGNVGDRLKVTSNTNVMEWINSGKAYSHNMIHSLSNGQTFYHLIIVPNDSVKYHFKYEVDAVGPTTVELFEAPTTTANGTAALTYNRERNSANTTGLLVYHGPTVTSDGTLLEGHSIGSSGGAKAGSTSASDEIVLKTNTKYLIKYVSKASSNDVSDAFFWYEAT
jgi:hypothetical protein